MHETFFILLRIGPQNNPGLKPRAVVR